MHPQRTAAALGQHVEITARLGSLDHAESGPLTGYRQILGVIGGDLQKYPAVRAALIGLAGGMQKTRTEFGTGRDMALVAHLEPHALQLIDMLVIAVDLGEQRHVVAGTAA